MARAATAANPNEDDKSAVPPAPADADALRGDAPTRHPSPRRSRPLKADTGERMAADAADAAAHE